MKRKKMSRKGKQFGTILIALAFIISLFSIAFYTENGNFIDYGNQNSGITGAVVGMESGTGADSAIEQIDKKVQDKISKSASGATTIQKSKFASSKELSDLETLGLKFASCKTDDKCSISTLDQLDKQYEIRRQEILLREETAENLFEKSQDNTDKDQQLAKKALNWQLKDTKETDIRDGAIAHLIKGGGTAGRQLLASTAAGSNQLQKYLTENYKEDYTKLKVDLEVARAAQSKGYAYDQNSGNYYDPKTGDVYRPIETTNGVQQFIKTTNKVDIATVYGANTDQKIKDLEASLGMNKYDYNGPIKSLEVVGTTIMAKDINGFLYPIDATKKEVIYSAKESPTSIKIGKSSLKRVDNYMQVDGSDELAVYKAADGTFYNQRNEKVTSVIKTEKHGNIRILEEIQVTNGKLEKKILSTKIQSGTSEPIAIDPIVKAQVVSAIKSAGKEAVIEGSLDEGSELKISNKDEKLISQITKTQSGDDEIDGFKIETLFTDDGQALNVFRTSPEGKVTVKETKVVKEIDTDNKDADCKPIKEKTIVTKEWVKLDEANKEKTV